MFWKFEIFFVVFVGFDMFNMKIYSNFKSYLNENKNCFVFLWVFVFKLFFFKSKIKKFKELIKVIVLLFCDYNNLWCFVLFLLIVLFILVIYIIKLKLKW